MAPPPKRSTHIKSRFSTSDRVVSRPEIAAERSPEEAWVRSLVHSLLIWETPLETGLWFSVFCLSFFLVRVGNYSPLSLACYVALLQIVLTAGAVRSAPFLKQIKLLGEDFDPKLFALQRQAFSVDELERFSVGASHVVGRLVHDWNDVLTSTSLRVLVRAVESLACVLILGKLFDVGTVVFVVVCLCFSVPFLKHSKPDEFGELLDSVVAKYVDLEDAFVDKAGPALDAVLRTEPEE